MTGAVDDALRKVVAALPSGGEVREGQLAMAEGVERALREERHLIVRAGTGTGKSLGYAVPVALSGKRVVVATATKALQDQLATKDLPLLASALKKRFSFSVLKGRSNYLCIQRVREARLAGEQGSLEIGSDSGRTALAEGARTLLEWAEVSTTGDRGELESEPDPRLWGAFSVTSDECPGAFRCPSGSDCFTEAARAKAAASDIVVVNIHLLGADLASDGAVLPDYDALVVDEAHELEDIVSASLGIRITAGRLRVTVIAARSSFSSRGGRSQVGTDAADAILDVAGRFEQILALRAGERLPAGPDGELGEIVTLITTRLERLEAELLQAVPENGGAASSEDAQALTRSALAVGHLRGDFLLFVSLDESHVAWVEGGSRAALELAPIDVAPILSEQLFSKRPVILTSATIPPGLGKRLGVPAGELDELDVGSPFAYEQNALLYCAAHVPDRRSAEAEGAIVEEISALIAAAGGRTLALFTSRKAMESIGALVRDRSEQPILIQGERSKGALIEEFRADPAVCLFATMGFWQGVDVPGDSLALVVIDRLPFARPDHPLSVARRERAGPEAFRLIDLPRAANLLAQGAGRLVRGANDRGVVAVLDSRLATASYRWDLVRALPPMRRTKVRAEAEKFLREIDSGASRAPASPTSVRDE